MDYHKIVAANLKMNVLPVGWDEADSPYHPHQTVDVIVLPAFLDIQQCIDAEMTTGAQCGHPQPKGAFTGNVSMTMLAEAGCTHVLCGHSERRKFQQETNADVAAQVSAALAAGLTPVVCIGETADERKAGKQEDVVTAQLKAIVGLKDLIVAYEPVWAIGNKGVAATPADIKAMHAFIRPIVGAATPILYGGSVNGKNAAEIFAQPNVDGALVGGASLDLADFGKIVEAAV